MKFNFPIEVCMEDFIKNGKFDCIQIGQSKEWILNNFPDPDGYFSMSHKDSIWKYGTIEFHFSENKLFMIFCEQLSLPDENGLKINKWIFDKLPLTMLACIEILNNECVDFRLVHSKYDKSVGITILNSGVCLIFYGEDVENSNDFWLLGFSKSINS